MAYNGGFPMGYQAYQSQYQMPQQNNGGIIWIQGEQAAKSYLTAPNTTVALWDSETQHIYLKTTDQNGIPSMRTLEYTILESQKAQKQVLNPLDREIHDYVTKSDLKGIYERLAALEGVRQHESSLSADARPDHPEV